MLEQGIVPHSFSNVEKISPPGGLMPIEQGIYYGVHFTMPEEHRDWLMGKIESWFDDRDEVIMVDTGVTTKQGLGYIVLEWEYCQPDPLFLAILRDEELVVDFTVYARAEEVE